MRSISSVPAFGHHQHEMQGLASLSMCYVLTDAETGAQIIRAGSDQRRSPASLTKLMTLYVVFRAMNENPDFHSNAPIRIPQMAGRLEPDVAAFNGLTPGNEYRAESLIVGVGARSDARGTLALALHAGKIRGWPGAGGIDRGDLNSERTIHDCFVTMMNREARTLGMFDTQFANAVGTPDDGNFSSPRDIAKLMAALQQEYPDKIRHACGQARFDIGDISTVAEHRSTLIRDYPGIEFLKTGHTEQAGYCLAAYANIGGRDLIGVVFGAGDDDHRNKLMISLFDRGRALCHHSGPGQRERMVMVGK